MMTKLLNRFFKVHASLLPKSLLFCSFVKEKHERRVDIFCYYLYEKSHPCDESGDGFSIVMAGIRADLGITSRK